MASWWILTCASVFLLATELKAQTDCGAGRWKCMSGACIPSSWRCDGQPDCTDSSDEANCPCSEIASQFKCHTVEQCIPMIQRCDNRADCSDSSDESNCTCNLNTHFECRTRKECIPLQHTCDGIADCSDGSDEDKPKPCTTITNRPRNLCTQSEFQCNNGFCIPKTWRCDRHAGDCRDNSDEQGCTYNEPPKTCTDIGPNLYKCNQTAQCIPMSFICDGERDCAVGGDDESNCGGTTRPPLTLPPTPGPCVSGNLANCGGSNLFMILGGSVGIQLIKLSSEQPTTNNVANVTRAYALAYDSVLSRVYYVDYFGLQPDQIEFKNVLLDTSRSTPAESKDFAKTNIGQPQGIAVDWINRLVYWTDDTSTTNSIQVAQMNGNFRQVLVVLGGNVKPLDIAVDPQNGLLFWTEFFPSPGKIVSSNLMGGDRKTVLSVSSPQGLALDITQRRIYFSDRSRYSLEYVTYDGKRDYILEESGTVSSIGVFQNYIYWLAGRTDIKSAQIDANLPRTTIKLVYTTSSTDSKETLSDMTLVHRDLQQSSIESPCATKNGGCEGLCFAVNSKVVCSCDGASKPFLAADQKSCADTPGVSLSSGQKTSVAEGDTLNLRCSVTKTPYFTITRLQWLRGNQPVSGTTIDTSKSYEVSTTLTVNNVGSEAAGSFRCEVSGTYNNAVSGNSRSVTSEASNAHSVDVTVSPSSDSNNTTIIIAIAVALSVAAVVIIIIVVACIKRGSKKGDPEEGTFGNPMYKSNGQDVVLTKSQEVEADYNHGTAI